MTLMDVLGGIFLKQDFLWWNRN